uniref:uncharacterized protein isoform X4 n=1 Tax=Semicossyphus pulcher TaxID=241346 RepID=UPI0037E926FC
MKNTKSLSDMHYYLLSVVCLLHSGLCAEECKQAVLARRETFHVLSGGSLSLSCVVKHCGHTWMGDWMWRNSTQEKAAVNAIKEAVPSQRSVLHRIFVCAGASLCLPIILGLANFMSSEVKPQPLPRTLSTHAAVSRNPTHSTPRPPPRCSQIQKGNPVPQKCGSSSQRAPPKPQWKTEVVYADISQDVPRQQGATREPAQSTVYSSLKFQNVNKAE